MSLYALTLARDSVIDPVITAYWPDMKGEMTEYPLNYLDELWSQSVFFRKRIINYTSFSYSGIHDILDKNAMEQLKFKLSVNTTSSYILWNEKGKFRWEKLDIPLQVSPITKIVVDDFNDDGYPDVLLGGNDYTYDVSTGYMDANKGIVLLNKGKNQEKGKPVFDILGPSKSGILLQGMLESLLYLKGDTSLVVAGFNRSKATVFEHKKMKGSTNFPVIKK
jgi:hypothetical protein